MTVDTGVRERHRRTGNRGGRIAAFSAGACTLAAGGALLSGLAGCSSASDMTCGDYLAQSSSDQKNTVIDLFDDHGDEQPQGVMISAAAGAIAGYCDAWGDDATLADAWDAFHEAMQGGSGPDADTDADTGGQDTGD